MSIFANTAQKNWHGGRILRQSAHPTHSTIMRTLAFLLTGSLFCLTVRSEEAPPDGRLDQLKDLNGYFPFAPSPDREAWNTRAAALRTQLLVALGLFPLPEKTPLKAVIHGRIDCGDYSVEKVFFESMPGFFVTGSLYRPAKMEGKGPAVLCPHGHWSDGRFYQLPEGGIAEQIRIGAEALPGNGGSPLQSRCATLARMGCTVFFYDMIGNAD